MILGHNIFSELKIGIFFSDDTMWVNGGDYQGCRAPMKDVSEINFNLSSYWLKGEIFHNEELWEIKHVLDTAWCTCHILDSHY